MKIAGTHIPAEILKSRRRRISEPALLELVHDIFREESRKEEGIINALYKDENHTSNNFIVEKLESTKIFHIADIEKTCVEYRLRFLNSALFKGTLPYEAIAKIKQTERDHQVKLEGFKIMAPASLFKLKNADDPLLFAPIGNGYYYLIHSWGKDLHPLRKLMMWPFRHLENFMLLLVVLSFLLATLVPEGMFSRKQTTTEFVIIFFFMFKWLTALAIFYGFKYGKNFSSAIWKSTYYNA